MVGHRQRQRLAAFDAFDQAGDDFAEARILEAVAQVGKAFEDRHAGARQLFEMEAEVDQLAARYFLAAEQRLAD